MKISVNGEMIEFDEETMSIQRLIEKLKYKEGFAVALNMTFVVSNSYNETMIRDGDIIDILSPVQGG